MGGQGQALAVDHRNQGGDRTVWMAVFFWLVVWNMNFIFPYIGDVIIPIDELIFFRGVQTTNQTTPQQFNGRNVGGACSGCGETPYVKLLTQMFGDRNAVCVRLERNGLQLVNITPMSLWFMDVYGTIWYL